MTEDINKIGKDLERSFYLRRPDVVARNLIGNIVLREYHGSWIGGTIVETEAYFGENDEVSHAYRGITERNKSMFKEGGHVYVYFTYGMHYCMNVVCGKMGVGRAVLLRAIRPEFGIETMKSLRKCEATNLTNGPAKLCQALGIDKTLDGISLFSGPVRIVEGQKSGIKIASSFRIGVKENIPRKARYYVVSDEFVSK